MRASGPFAMGPSLVGSGRRVAPRSNFSHAIPPGMPRSGTLGSGLTQTTAPTLGVKNESKSEGDVKAESDEEVYSEPDEGVEIVDLNDVRKMDWMAPETLKRESEHKRRVKPKKKKDEKKPLAGIDQEEGLLARSVPQHESDLCFSKIWMSTNRRRTMSTSRTP
jgi:DNA-directed RNA polymerase III subunit RPC4